MGRIIKKDSEEARSIMAAEAQPLAGAPVEQGELEPGSAIGSAIQGLGEGASFGFLDELKGAAGAVGEAQSMGREALGVEEKGTTANPYERILRAYRAERAAGRQDLKKSREAHPVITGGAELVGALTAPVLKGASLAKQGLAAGAAYGLGQSEADLTRGDVRGAAGDTGEGAGAGLVAGRLTQGLGSKLGPWLKRRAEEKAIRAAGAQKPDLKALAEKSRTGDPNAEARRLGRKLLDMRDKAGNPMLGRIDSAENIAEKMGVAQKETGQAIGGTVSRIQDDIERQALYEVGKRPVKIADVQARLLKQADEAMRGSQPDLADALMAEANELDRVMAARLEAGDFINLKLPESEQVKQSLQRALQKSYGKMTGPAIEARKSVASAYRQAAEDAIGSQAGPEELEQFIALKKRMGDLKELGKISKRGSVSEAARMDMGLSEQNAALGALETGGDPAAQLLKAAAAAAKTRFLRGRGDALSARTMERMRGMGPEATNAAALEAKQGADSVSEEDRKRLARYIGLME